MAPEEIRRKRVAQVKSVSSVKRLSPALRECASQPKAHQQLNSVTRPVFVGRNSYRGANIYQIDVRYTRTIASLWERVKPQFIFEVNNIFNHPNYTAYDTVVRTNTSGQPVDANNNEIQLPTSFTPTASTVLEGPLVQFGLAVRF